jgi:hypothetical protein
VGLTAAVVSPGSTEVGAATRVVVGLGLAEEELDEVLVGRNVVVGAGTDVVVGGSGDVQVCERLNCGSRKPTGLPISSLMLASPARSVSSVGVKT